MASARVRPTSARAGAALLLAGSVAQLAAQAGRSRGLADRPGDDLWTEIHLLLVVAVLGLLLGSLALVRSLGGTMRGRALLAAAASGAGYGCALATLAHDLGAVDLSRSVLSVLDLLDLLGVAGTVTILVCAAMTASGLWAGGFAACAGLAVPMTDGLEVVASTAAVVGFTALALAAARLRDSGGSRVAPWLVLVAFCVAGLVSWPRAALAAYVAVLVFVAGTPSAGRPRPSG